ncbi:T7SS effector LXG polymorphic toxin [Bacillus wiedmannii]|uniref:T7SS effector LXG polymorphic toxin n=1 Tax=Bacillus wiedmannii TaxID=1890302 RepID=UPI003525C3C7
MSLNMYLGEVQNQTQSMNAVCTATIQGMEQAIQSIDAFATDTVLQGQTYSSAKAFFVQTFRPLAQGIIYLCEELIVQNDAFPSQFASKVASTDVIEQEIREQIKEINQSIASIEMMNAVTPMPGIDALVAVLVEMRKKLEEKLEHLYEFNYTSSSNYDTALQLASSIATGLSEVQGGKGFSPASGTFSTQGLNMDWTGAINKITEDKNRKVDNLIQERSKDGILSGNSGKSDDNYISSKINSMFNTKVDSNNHFIFKESGAVVGDQDKKSNVFAKVLKYETDIQLPKNVNTFFGDLTSFDKIGGEAKGALIDAGFKAGDFTIHEQLLRAEVKAQFGGGIGGEAKIAGTFNDIGVDHDSGKLHVKLGDAEASVFAKDGYYGFGAKADLAKVEGEVKLELPFTDWKLVVGGDVAYGSIGGEAKFGLKNEFSVGLGIGLGIKLGVEK